MSDIIEIRQERPEDQSDVYKLIAAAFNQDDEAELVDALRVVSEFIPELSLVALLEGKIVGHILFTKININGPDAYCKSLSMAPVSVLPQHHGQGIGSQLITQGLQRCKELDHRSVIVLGHEHYYPRFGFRATTEWNITAPFKVRPEVFMGLELTPGALSDCSGEVEYAAPFYP